MPKWYCSDFRQILIGLSLKDNIKRATSGLMCQLPINYNVKFPFVLFCFHFKINLRELSANN